MAGQSRQVAIIAIAGLFAFSASRFTDTAALYFPDEEWLGYGSLATLFFALTASLVVWSGLPALLAEPSPGELMEANKALSGAAELRAAEVARLAATQAELERAVRERTLALDEANQRFKLALRNSEISMVQQDRDLRYIWVHNAPKGMAAADLLGRFQKDVLPEHVDAPLGSAKRGVMANETPDSLEFSIAIGGVTRHFHENIEPVLRDGAVIGVLVTSIETTSYRRQQDELRGLLREVTHRTKNLLAVIMGIARQSGRSSKDVSTFVARFNGRIRALAVAHELLVDSEWRGVAIRRLVWGVWKAVSPETLNLLTLEGDGPDLAPECAQNLALALYEMQSNAIEHGGLLAPGGGVRICWATSEDDPDLGVKMVWEETGRPSAPAQTIGFGKTYVHGLLPRATKGRSAMHFHENGLTWTLTLPRSNFVANAGAQGAIANRAQGGAK
ncbi:two-component sensor histidine kinase [Rhodoblastus sphagnicola]|uniref:HWE histidine kinase domain-containing protein n=1 Tax=Rhodoblastus sphagnicola TaxID=333368 RepID=UPI001304DE46|nr:HWE histidine kinase domain-containing protein [Rhodoblastus sphagnicola]MBB4198922.1 two-component sensor histidine kinase [Rhodoblastus sphagnicola]